MLCSDEEMKEWANSTQTLRFSYSIQEDIDFALSLLEEGKSDLSDEKLRGILAESREILSRIQAIKEGEYYVSSESE